VFPPRALGITEIAREVGLNVSTAHRLVRALCHAGFMEQEPAGERYRLVSSPCSASVHSSSRASTRTADPARIAATTGESASWCPSR
jgi:IclR family acetate operon transcriptional repressor